MTRRRRNPKPWPEVNCTCAKIQRQAGIGNIDIRFVVINIAVVGIHRIAGGDVGHGVGRLTDGGGNAVTGGITAVTGDSADRGDHHVTIIAIRREELIDPDVADPSVSTGSYIGVCVIGAGGTHTAGGGISGTDDQRVGRNDGVAVIEFLQELRLDARGG